MATRRQNRYRTPSTPVASVVPSTPPNLQAFSALVNSALNNSPLLQGVDLNTLSQEDKVKIAQQVYGDLENQGKLPDFKTPVPETKNEQAKLITPTSQALSIGNAFKGISDDEMDQIDKAIQSRDTSSLDALDQANIQAINLPEQKSTPHPLYSQPVFEQLPQEERKQVIDEAKAKLTGAKDKVVNNVTQVFQALQDPAPLMTPSTISASVSDGFSEVSSSPDFSQVRKEESKKNEAVGTTGGDTFKLPEEESFFDRVNSRVDLMAMGAALLARSGSGRSTLENLGEALQVGIKSKQAQNVSQSASDMAKARLALDLAKFRQGKPLTQPQGVKALEAELAVYGAEGKTLPTVANYLYNHPILSKNLAQLNPTQRRTYLEAFVKKGQGWFGDEVKFDKLDDADKAGRKALLKLAQKGN